MKLIFLDIDGVLNCQAAYIKGECNYVTWTNHLGEKDHHQSFCSWSKELLNELIAKTDAKIVVSSTWRHSGLEFMKSVWAQEQMAGEIIGITPSFGSVITEYTVPRGCEIDYYLKENMGFRHINWSKDAQQLYIDKSGIENYIILDDDSDMLYSQRNHFVHVKPSPRNKTGFNTGYFEEALGKLSKSVIDLNYI